MSEHPIDAAIAAMDEADVRAGMTAAHDLQRGLTPGSVDFAEAIGNAALEDLCAAFDLGDPSEVLERTQRRGEVQGTILLRTLGVQASRDVTTLVVGSTSAGILTGLRLGLLIAEDRQRDLEHRAGQAAAARQELAAALERDRERVRTLEADLSAAEDELAEWARVAGGSRDELVAKVRDLEAQVREAGER